MCIFQTTGARHLDANTPWLQGVSDLWWTPGLCPCSDQFLDDWEDMCTRSQSSIRNPQAPSEDETPSFPFRVSHTLCLYLHSLSTFNKLCFHLLLARVWFLSCMQPGTLLAGPVGWPAGSWDPAGQHHLEGGWEHWRNHLPLAPYTYHILAVIAPGCRPWEGH